MRKNLLKRLEEIERQVKPRQAEEPPECVREIIAMMRAGGPAKYYEVKRKNESNKAN